MDRCHPGRVDRRYGQVRRGSRSSPPRCTRCSRTVATNGTSRGAVLPFRDRKLSRNADRADTEEFDSWQLDAHLARTCRRPAGSRSHFSWFSASAPSSAEEHLSWLRTGASWACRSRMAGPRTARRRCQDAAHRTDPRGLARAVGPEGADPLAAALAGRRAHRPRSLRAAPSLHGDGNAEGDEGSRGGSPPGSTGVCDHVRMSEPGGVSHRVLLRSAGQRSAVERGPGASSMLPGP